MNNKKRLEFWNELDKPTNEIDLMKFEKYIPKKLYRYRKVDSNSLSALLNNRLYFSTSNYYDDPFDTLFCINKEELKNEINAVLTHPNAQEDFNRFHEMNNKKYNIDIEYVLKNKKRVFEWVDNTVKNIQDTFKNEIYSICFSESDLNQDLWLKYADNYSGFVIEYGVDSIRSSYNNTYTKDDTLINNCKNYLYPIVYYNKPFYANDLFKCIIYRVSKMDYLIKDWNRFLFDRRRVCLVKDKFHSNDKEWRLFVDNMPSYINVAPKAVIMGLKTSDSNKDLLYEICRKNKIDLYQTYISNDYKLKKKCLIKNNN